MPLPEDGVPRMVVAQAEPVGDLELVMTFDGAMPTGVAVSGNQRLSVCFPRWDDPVEYAVSELRKGHLVPYPSGSIQQAPRSDPAAGLISVQSVVADARDRLWILDTGAPRHETTWIGGPKLVGVDLAQDRVIRTIQFPADVTLRTTYFNDVRFDLQAGAAGTAYITDSSPVRSGLIVVDLAFGQSWRRLDNHPSTKAEPGFLPAVEGRPLMLRPANSAPQP